MKYSILFFAIAISLLSLGCKDKSEIPNPQEDTLAQAIENIIQPMVANKTTVGAAVGIIKPGGEKEMFFFGEKHKNEGDTPGENTLFEIGSITKTMTATILADMILKGEVSLDDAVEDHLPGIGHFPDYDGEKITFKHLANHTSSLPYIPDNLLNDHFDEDNPFLNYTEEMMYDFFNTYTLPQPIGSIEEYSNLAFGTLGHVIGEIRGSSFENQLQALFSDGFSLNNTHVRVPENNTNVAQPYNGNRKAVPAWNFSDVTLGAGGVKSNLKDMLTFLEANMGYGNSNLKDALALAHENTQTLNAPFGKGLAWVNIFKAEDNTTLTWHNGGTAGTVTFIGFVKELDMGVVLMFNTEIAERSGEDLLELKKGVEVIDAMKKY